MNEKFDLEKEITRLLTPQEKLAPWIFDENGKMLFDVREGLLDIADDIVSETIAGVEGLEVFDVCLTGSSSGYLYKDNSDIDIRIEVHHKGGADVSSDEKLFNQFLFIQKDGFMAHKHDLYFHGRYVDVKMSDKQFDLLSLYSIKNNKWLIEPTRDYAKGLTVQEMTDYYLKEKKELLAKTEDVKARYKGFQLGKALNELYSEVAKYRPTIKEYFVFKLLHSECVLAMLRKESIAAYNEGCTKVRGEI